jgi:hypothetical protein
MNAPTSADWAPVISPQLARKWLSIDSYRKSVVVDPCALPLPDPPLTKPPAAGFGYDPELLRQFPLTDQAGHPRRSRLHDPQQTDWQQPSLLEALVDGLHNLAAQSKWSEARAQMEQITRLCAALPRHNPTTDCLQQAEVRLEFALAFRTLGERAQALNLILTCLKDYQRGADPHAEALTRWIAGYFYLEVPQTYLSEGLAHWQTSWSLFARFAGDPNQHNKAEAQWYQRRAALMLTDLNQALQQGSIHTRVPEASAAPSLASDISTQPEEEANTTAPSAQREAPAASERASEGSPQPEVLQFVSAGAYFQWGEVPLRVTAVARDGSAPGVVVERMDGQLFEAQGDLPASTRNFLRRDDVELLLTTGAWKPCDELPPPPSSSLAEAWLKLATPRVYAEVAAHPAGRLVNERPSKLLAPKLECQVIVIDNQPYSTHSTQGRKTSPPRVIALQPEDCLIRVRGDSMNRAKPVPIEDGDYVLVRPNADPENGQIVVLRVDDDQGHNTVKRRRADQFEAESTKKYKPIRLQDARKIVGQVLGVAKPLRSPPQL